MLKNGTLEPRATNRCSRASPRFPRTGIASLSVCTLLSCAAPEPAPPSQPLYPAESSQAPVTQVEFGPGSLQTRNDLPWGGRASVRYPLVLDAEAAPVELQIDGLDLSRIEYSGDLGWPPDATDKGAIVLAGFSGANEIAYRIWSSVATQLGTAEEASGRPLSPADFRAYQFRGYFGNVGTFGAHELNLERWGPPESRGPYNTVDVRLRYADGLVRGWVRLHASHEWDDGGRERGGACPWNVALNNAVPGTADSIWRGECRAGESGETGRPVGAWVPFAGGAWRPQVEPRSVQTALSILNWEHAEGPYEVRWDNLIVRGVPDARLARSSGEGTLRTFGTGQSEVEPRGEWASFGYQVVDQGTGGPAAAFLRYRVPGLDLASETTSWAIIEADQVRFAGEARVNGAGAYRYELRAAAAAGDAPDSLMLQVWRSGFLSHPYYQAFGSLAAGSIGTRLPAPDGT